MTINQLNEIANRTPNENLSLSTSTENSLSVNGELSQMIQNFNNMNTSEIDNIALTDDQVGENLSSEKNFT